MMRIVSLVGMAGILAIAYLIERGLEVLKPLAVRQFNALPFLWAASAADLLLAGLLLLLAWLVNSRGARSRVVGLIFLVVGWLLAFAHAIAITGRLHLPQTGLPLLPYLSSGSRVVYAAAFIAVLGAVSLFRPNSSA